MERRSAEEYDPYLREVQDDPYPYYADVRQGCPLHLLDRTGMYSLSRFDDVAGMLRDHETYSSRYGPGPERVPLAMIGGAQVLVLADEPEHSQHRQLVARAFSLRRILSLEPRMRQISEALIDGFIERGHAEFMAEYAYIFPVTVIAELLGVPAADRADFKRWSSMIVNAVGGTEEQVALAIAGMQEFGGYILARAEERKKDLDSAPDDLMTALVRLDIDDLNLVTIATQLLNAGHETSSNMLTTMMHLLCTHPAELAKLRRDPSLIENAVEEVLRFDAPVQGICRTNNIDVEWYGTRIPPDTKIRAVLAAGNRDHRRWGEDAEEFRVDRDLHDVRQHLAFGYGNHYCLGAPMARLEGKVALTDIIERLEDVALDAAVECEQVEAFLFRGWQRLGITFRPGTRRGADRPDLGIGLPTGRSVP